MAETWAAFDAFMTMAVPVGLGVLVLGTLLYCLWLSRTFTPEATEWHKAIVRSAERGEIPANDHHLVNFWPDISEKEAARMTRDEAETTLTKWLERIQ